MVYSEVDTQMLVGFFSIFAFIYFCIRYKRLIGKEIGFPMYIYFAMFPHKLRVFSIFSADDAIMKTVLITDLVLLLVRSKKVKYNSYEVIFLLAVLVVDSVAFASGEVDQALLLSGAVNIIFLFMFSFTFRNRVTTEKGMKTIFKIILHNSIILSVGAILEIVFYNVERAELGMGNPNYLSYYLTIAFCVFFYGTQRFRFIHFCYGAILVIGVLCTGSYSMLVCFPAFMLIKFVYGMVEGSGKTILSKILASSMLILVVFLIWMSTSEEMLSVPIVRKVLDDKDASRLFIWKEALLDFQNNPILGVGYNTWRSQYGVGYVTHNDALRILVEMGIVGLSAFLVYWRFIVRKISRSKSENQPLYISALLTLVIFSCFHNNMNSLMFWVILSLPLYDNLIVMREEKES